MFWTRGEKSIVPRLNHISAGWQIEIDNWNKDEKIITSPHELNRFLKKSDWPEEGDEQIPTCDWHHTVSSPGAFRNPLLELCLHLFSFLENIWTISKLYWDRCQKPAFIETEEILFLWGLHRPLGSQKFGWQTLHIGNSDWRDSKTTAV